MKGSGESGSESIELFLRTRLSCSCMIWLLAHPPLLSVSSTGDTQEDWETDTTCWRDRGEGKEPNYTPQESLVGLVLYQSFNTLWSGVQLPQSTYTLYKEYHSVCPLVGIGTLPSPNPSLAPPPILGGGAHSPAGEGLGESQFRRPEKKLGTLPSLWQLATNFLTNDSLSTVNDHCIFVPSIQRWAVHK
jgi:hypothetical protein